MGPPHRVSRPQTTARRAAPHMRPSRRPRFAPATGVRRARGRPNCPLMASARLPLSGAIAKHRSQTSAQVTELSSYLRAADFSVHPVVRLLALRCARARVRVRRAASSFIMDQRGITVSIHTRAGTFRNSARVACTSNFEPQQEHENAATSARERVTVKEVNSSSTANSKKGIPKEQQQRAKRFQRSNRERT